MHRIAVRSRSGRFELFRRIAREVWSFKASTVSSLSNIRFSLVFKKYDGATLNTCASASTVFMDGFGAEPIRMLSSSDSVRAPRLILATSALQKGSSDFYSGLKRTAH